MLGVYNPIGQLVGFVTSPPDYPSVGDWYIGVMVLAPEERGMGLGEGLYRAFEVWAGEQGAIRILLSVVDDNPRGQRFWERMGFSEMKRVPPKLRGAKTQGVVEMVRRLSLDTPLF